MNLLYIADPNSLHDLRWIRHFAQRGAKVFLLPRQRHHAMMTSSGSGKAIAPEITLLPPLRDPSTIRPWVNSSGVRQISDTIAGCNIDLLHLLYAEPNALWARFKRDFNVPVFVTTRGTDVLKTIPAFYKSRNLFHRVIARQYRNAFNQADLITTTSECQKSSIRKMGVNARIELIRTGVDFGVIRRSKNGIASKFSIEKPFVLMPRSMRPLYYHEFTLQAISLLDESIRKKLSFVFVDSNTRDGDYYTKVVDQAKQVDATIRFLPTLSHEEITMLYHESELVVMNPRSDGSPVSAMEAMACNKPVIMPPLPYDDEIFSGAFRFLDWTPKSLSREITKVLEMDQKTINFLCERNYEVVHKRANTESEMNKLFQLYQSFTSV